MKSVKPGRGPSMMSGVSSIAAALFGIFWMIIAASMGAVFMVPFGLIFVGLAIAGAVYNFKNATSKNRYSAFDITDNREEPDPLNEVFNQQDHDKSPDIATDTGNGSSKFCPYCGASAGDGFVFCNKCGKDLP